MAAKHDASTIFLLTNTKIYLAMLRLVNEMAAGAPGAPRTYGDAPVPVRATRAELAFLRGMLADEAYAFLLPAALRTKLRARLACATDDGTKPANDSATDGTAAANGSAGATAAADVAAFFRTNALRLDDTTKEPLRTRLEQLWTALTHQKKIAYTYRAADGTVYPQAAAAPVRLQYDCALGSYSLIVWDAQKEQAVWRDVRRLERVRVTDKPFDAEAIRAAFDAFLRRERRRVRLTLRDLPEKNALVRFYARFERYDKTAVMRADGTYDVVIDYYTFDEHDIVAGILSLGPCLLVEGPARLRAAVIDRLSEALAHQAPLDA